MRIMANLGLFLLRVVIGLIVAAHGGQKLFGWFSGGGIAGSLNTMRKLNIYPPLFWALGGGVNEFGGGILLALGLLMPLGALMLLAAMFVAVYRVHWAKGFWSSQGGYEWKFALLVNAFALGLTGPGAYSVAAAYGLVAPGPLTMAVG